MQRTRVIAALIVTSAIVLLACPTDPFSGSDSKDGGLSGTTGPYTWTVSANVPLGNSTSMSCTATASGTTTVGGDGSYSIAFPPLSCSGCTMTVSTSGTISHNSVDGTLTATTDGSGCSTQHPSPSPATVSGSCDTSTCTGGIENDASYYVGYTLTPG